MNPYKNMPESSFWKSSVTDILQTDIDPLINVPFKINKEDLVSTMGSCFAQHISKHLVKNGFNYFIAEKSPEGMTALDAAENNYGIFSARYGNLYTIKQAVQLFKRALGVINPLDDYWLGKNNEYIDPYRPRINLNGFYSFEELQENRREHYKAVQNIIKKSNVIVFTLGLTETWQRKEDGTVFPLAPGVISSFIDDQNYEAKNFNVTEIISDMKEFIGIVRAINPTCKFIFTVSPVPLIATHTNEHVLSATTYSKSVLRVAVKEIVESYEDVMYFPSYEIIFSPGSMGRYFEDDLRSVNDLGVSHVMKIFTKKVILNNSKNSSLIYSISENAKSEIVCDEETIQTALDNLKK